MPPETFRCLPGCPGIFSSNWSPHPSPDQTLFFPFTSLPGFLPLLPYSAVDRAFQTLFFLLGFPFFVYLGGIRTLAPEKILLRTEILEEDRARLGIRMLQHAASVLLPLVLSHHVSLMSGLGVWDRDLVSI